MINFKFFSRILIAFVTGLIALPAMAAMMPALRLVAVLNFDSTKS